MTGADSPDATLSHARDEFSAGGVVVRNDGGQVVFLLIRDSYKNWGFPKGHIETGEKAEDAARREVTEETGLADVAVRGCLDEIDWHFRFRGQVIHKICRFFLMETGESETSPQRAEGITACRWASFEEALALISYSNAREVLQRAKDMVEQSTTPVWG
jgi:8-oxo-dGTP pyrophosphatase MutT (NUDIX family)